MRDSGKAITAPAYMTAAEVRTLSTSSAQTSALAAGSWMLVADVDTFIKRGSTNDATTRDFTLFLPAFTPMPISMDGTDKLACILASGTGNLYCLRP